MLQRSSLQSSSGLILDNVKTASQQLAKHQDLLNSLVVYPLPQFPGRTQEHILQSMLRTRLEPGVQDWVDRGQALVEGADESYEGRLSDEDLQELWQTAPQVGTLAGMGQKFSSDYTVSEIQGGIENVRTGLKRELIVPPEDESPTSEGDDLEDDEEISEEDEAEDEDSRDVVEVRRQTAGPGPALATASKNGMPAMPLDNVFRFMMTGASDRKGPV